jgi:hypothetical protein
MPGQCPATISARQQQWQHWPKSPSCYGHFNVIFVPHGNLVQFTDHVDSSGYLSSRMYSVRSPKNPGILCLDRDTNCFICGSGYFKSHWY